MFRYFLIPMGIATFLLAHCSDSSFAGRSRSKGGGGGAEAGGQENGVPVDSNGDGVPDYGEGAGTVPQPQNPEQVVEACLNGQHQTLRKTLFYPGPGGCAFNQDGNFDKLQGFIQARREETQLVELPQNAVICDLKIESKTDQIHYDDFFTFTIEQYIIAGSSGKMMSYLAKEGDLLVWDFAKVRGTECDFNDTLPAYCINGPGACVMPPHDRPGRFNINMSTEQIKALALKLIKKGTLGFKLIVTGDNDFPDCEHTDVNVDVSIDYVLTK